MEQIPPGFYGLFLIKAAAISKKYWKKNF